LADVEKVKSIFDACILRERLAKNEARLSGGSFHIANNEFCARLSKSGDFINIDKVIYSDPPDNTAWSKGGSV